MPKYSAVVAKNVPTYGRVSVEADSPEEAMEMMRAMAHNSSFDTITMESSDDGGTHHRVLDLMTPTDEGPVFHYEDVELTEDDKDWKIISKEHLALRLKQQSQEEAA